MSLEADEELNSDGHPDTDSDLPLKPLATSSRLSTPDLREASRVNNLYGRNALLRSVETDEGQETTRQFCQKSFRVDSLTLDKIHKRERFLRRTLVAQLR